jgi:CBS-domain-containing membrane protein
MRRPLIWIHRAVGAGLAIGLMELLAYWDGEPLVRVPFVTSIVLVTLLPQSEAARPAAIIGGHLLSAIAGLIALWALGPGEAATVVGVGLATLLMAATRLVHPPGGIDAFLIPAEGLPAIWVVNPVLIGAVLLAVFAGLWFWSERTLRRRFEPHQPEHEHWPGAAGP